MKIRLGLFILAAVALGAIALWVATHPRSTATTMQYATYRGEDASLLIQLDYPQSWKTYEEKGKVDPYRKVRFTGPRNADGTYSSFISIISEPMKPFGGRYENARQMQAALAAHAPLENRLLSEGQRRVGGVEGIETTRAFTMPAFHHKGIKPKAVAVRERVVLLEKSPYLFQLIYSADERDFEQFAGVFDRLIKSFKFL